MLIFELMIILVSTKLAGDLAARLGQPSVLGKLLIGLILGPSVLGLIEHTDFLSEISQIGVILLMFIAGLETDLQEFKRSGKAGALVGLGGIVVPLGLGWLSGLLIGLDTLEAIFLGLLLSATSVSITVQSLREMGRLNTREGNTLMSAAVIDDVVVVILLAFLLGFAGGDVNLPLLIGKKAAFFLIAILVGWKAVPWLLQKFVPLRVTEAVVTMALALCFLFAWFAELTGVAAIIGAYIAGVAIAQTRQKEEVMHKTETIAYSIFVPVFFTSIGVMTDLQAIGSSWWLVAVLSVVAVLSKWIGSGFGAKLAGFSTQSSLAVGAGMISRGEVALIIAAIGMEAGLLDRSLFAVLVVVVLVTTVLTPPLLKLTFPKREA
ncbi:sodium/proton-potassium antiporter GerN (CPA2 family) [Tumebacillus sp. BK434]|uniref:cation:proton antiporter n=1 Tax=Tumebacillus sp. BK434 TaxID=2512169 RepID=UPI0010465FEA|nr:cation:proton antiporter [Tumebacillus sp. BK434]TCP55675.1 sodium/proton-potassium antiporter GerN (CPA2 family) [Tumebacillus sp. BK434]